MDEGLLNDLLECSVCLERLDTSSRVLPCQHTFCLKCLKVIVESHKELRCPECRVLVELKVEELPPNVLLMRILEGMKNSAPRKVVSGQRTSRSGHSQVQGLQSREGKQLPPHARALFDYISKEPGDLSFKKGETIVLQKKLDPFWYQGECSGRSGIFPITFVQIVIPLPVATALCKALYDFRMSTPDEEGCLAFDKGAIITVHRRVDDNWAEGRLEQRVGIFPIAFVELNQAARQLMNSVPLNRPVPPLPDLARPSHSDHRHHAQHSHRFQQMSMSTPTNGQNNYQNVATMSQSHPNYAQPMLSQPQILLPQPISTINQVTVAHTGLVTAVPRILEPSNKHSIDLIQFNMHSKHQGTMGIQNVSRIGENYDRLRTVKYDYNTPIHKVEVQNRQEHFPISVANFNQSNVSSDSSSSMNTPANISSTTTPNTSSNTSTCESAEPSLPSSPDNNTDRNTTVVTVDEENREESTVNTSMGVLSLNESSTATNTSLNVSLPESPKLNASNASTSIQSQGEDQENASNIEPLDTPSSSKVIRPSGPESLLNFGLGLQAALSPSHAKENYSRTHREHHRREKRHSLTPSTHLQGNHSTPNRHSAEVVATSLLDGSDSRRRAVRYIALYPYKPQKPDELELKKGGVYTVTERCRDGWYKGIAERDARAGVFPGNYVTPAHLARPRHDKPATTTPSGPASAPVTTNTTPAPDAPPRARSPVNTTLQQPLTYPWSGHPQPQQSTPRTDKQQKEKTKAEKSSISTGVSLMKRLAAMKKCKSPPPSGYSMDNPVFEDGPGTSLMLNLQHQPVHVRSGSCPSQLLRSLPPQRERHKLLDHQLHRANPENPWQTQHRKSQSLDVTATRRDRHHSQPIKERFRCIVPYPPNSEYELELKVDDIVIVSKKRGDGWYKGTLQRTGRTGLFPASFVQSCPE